MEHLPASQSSRRDEGILLWGSTGMLLFAVYYDLQVIFTAAEDDLSYIPILALYSLGGLALGLLIGIAGAFGSLARATRSAKTAKWILAILAPVAVVIFLNRFA